MDFGVPILHISGLDNYSLPHPNLKLRPAGALANATPNSGSGPGGTYRGSDFRTAYVPGTTLTGAGQTVGLLQFDGFYANDIATYATQAGLPNIPVTVVPVDGGVSTPGSGNGEVCLDIEMIMSMAPGVTNIYVFEAPNPSPWVDLLNAMATHNPLSKQLSCSWGGGSRPHVREYLQADGCPGPVLLQCHWRFRCLHRLDPLPLGQHEHYRSRRNHADYRHGRDLRFRNRLELGKQGSSYVGSSGGISTYYPIPSYQQGISMVANKGSTTMRNVPDVALTGDNVYVVYNNGGTGTFGGTSCAAPLWAGFTALVNQQAWPPGRPRLVFLIRPSTAIGKGTNYSSVFHDTTAGNNFSSSSPAKFSAVVGYDLCTGWGTPNGTNFINALAPHPYILTPPASQTATNGNNATFTVIAGGQPPLSYRWLFNGTNLPAGGNVSGTTSNLLSITSISSSNVGSYSVLVTNSYGSVTSSVATLAVVLPPLFNTQPTNVVVAAGSTAVLSATVSGAAPLVYQWRQNGTNLASGGNVSGTTTNVLTLTAVTVANAGSYALVVTNVYGAATSSVATVDRAAAADDHRATVGTDRTMRQQCGLQRHGFRHAVAQLSVASGQCAHRGRDQHWSVADQCTSAHSHCRGRGHQSLRRRDQFRAADRARHPAAARHAQRRHPRLCRVGQRVPDPGATAYDLCAGAVPVVATGTVNTNAVSTNTITYTATDGNGNTNTATRTVIVRDTTPPTILWSFTNLVLVAGTNCTAAMPAVTGTNYLLATDLSGVLTLTQVPTNTAALPLGTNVVVITVADASGNASYSTNQVVVQDQTPPVILLEPQSQTNTVGANAAFSVAAMACAPLAFQWHFDNTVLAAQTNSMLMLSNLQSSAGGNYLVVVTASGGSATSAVATLTMVLPPTITVPPLAQTVQCGSNAAFSVTATGTPPLNYQWSLDSVPIAGATSTGLSLTNVHLPTHTVAVVVASPYGGVTSSVPLIVQDTLPPILTLNGSTPAYVELGSAFLDPGATAYDVCAGAVPVVATGTVNTNAVSTNTVTYTATDGNGNTNTATRTVIVRDTTPPTILWSFTNLVLAAGTNCTAAMPDVTGTNYLLATDLSGTLTVTQVPTNSAALSLGTNVVIITVADASGNASYATNEIIVQDQTPPVILLEPQSQTNTVGASAGFSVTAAACTPLTFQWYFNNTTLAAQTNNTLTLSNLQSTAGGDYLVVVTAAGGVATSSVATLTVLLPPTITGPPLAQTVQCGSNAAFSVTATGTPPLNYQWSLDSVPIAGATSTGLLLTNAHLPTHTVAVVVTNLYGGVTSSVALTVQDTLPPILTLNGSNPVLCRVRQRVP